MAEPVFPLKLASHALTDPETCGSVLLLIALAKYKEATFQMDSMTVVMELEEDYQVHIPEDNENKLKAMLLATETQVFQQSPEAFRGICSTLWHGDPRIDGKEPLTLSEAIWGTFEVRACHGEVELSSSISAIIAQLSENEVGDSEQQPDPFEHVREAVTERYKEWHQQMTTLGVNSADLPGLESASI